MKAYDSFFSFSQAQRGKSFPICWAGSSKKFKEARVCVCARMQKVDPIWTCYRGADIWGPFSVKRSCDEVLLGRTHFFIAVFRSSPSAHFIRRPIKIFVQTVIKFMINGGQAKLCVIPRLGSLPWPACSETRGKII